MSCFSHKSSTNSPLDYTHLMRFHKKERKRKSVTSSYQKLYTHGIQ